MNVKLKS